jgi:hypothetical protein
MNNPGDRRGERIVHLSGKQKNTKRELGSSKAWLLLVFSAFRGFISALILTPERRNDRSPARCEARLLLLNDA